MSELHQSKGRDHNVVEDNEEGFARINEEDMAGCENDQGC